MTLSKRNIINENDSHLQAAVSYTLIYACENEHRKAWITWTCYLHKSVLFQTFNFLVSGYDSHRSYVIHAFYNII